mmetsp:Transcript_9613/g.22743  ORF Transcript_9613/g.22743 Transcript_9613/m.22743 type:complete len:363 (-) Transcript_9613:1506-2594(-)
MQQELRARLRGGFVERLGHVRGRRVGEVVRVLVRAAVGAHRDRNLVEAEHVERAACQTRAVGRWAEVRHDTAAVDQPALGERAEQHHGHLVILVLAGVRDDDGVDGLRHVEREAREEAVGHEAADLLFLARLEPGSLGRGATDEVLDAADELRHAVEVGFAQRGDRRDEGERVVHFEIGHVVPDRLVLFHGRDVPAAERVAEPRRVAPRRQPAAVGVVARQADARPEVLDAGLLRVLQPAADGRVGLRQVVVHALRDRARVGGEAAQDNHGHAELLAAAVEEVRCRAVELVVLRRIGLEVRGRVVLVEGLDPAHDGDVTDLIDEELLVVAQEERGVLERRDEHHDQGFGLGVVEDLVEEPPA